MCRGPLLVSHLKDYVTIMCVFPGRRNKLAYLHTACDTVYNIPPVDCFRSHARSTWIREKRNKSSSWYRWMLRKCFLVRERGLQSDAGTSIQILVNQALIALFHLIYCFALPHRCHIVFILQIQHTSCYSRIIFACGHVLRLRWRTLWEFEWVCFSLKVRRLRGYHHVMSSLFVIHMSDTTAQAFMKIFPVYFS